MDLSIKLGLILSFMISFLRALLIGVVNCGIGVKIHHLTLSRVLISMMKSLILNGVPTNLWSLPLSARMAALSYGNLLII